jgi:membrane protease YdiL (CAAX protease family)
MSRWLGMAQARRWKNQRPSDISEGVQLPAAGETPARSRWRWLELLALFGAGPALLARAPGAMVIPGILIGAGVCLTLLLRDRSFDRRRLWNTEGVRRSWRPMLLRTTMGCLALLLLVVAVSPEALFQLPRTRTGLWLLIMIAYPLLSVYPQELIFRTFLFHRYRDVLPPRALLVVSALAFGYAHIVLHNLPSVLLSTLGGLLFASSYRRSNSTLLVALEHALYGCFVFSVGLGGLFYAGGRTLSSTFRL